MRLQNWAKALLVLWPALCSQAVAEEEPTSVHLGLNEAREVALTALRSGQPKLAFALSDGLVQADAKDGHALYIKAKSLGQMQDFDGGRKVAAKAYRVDSTDLQHYESAMLAAQLSFAKARMTHSQIWLRRAIHHAPSSEFRDATISAFRQVRRQNPVSAQLRVLVSPSNNINNGANSPFNIIDGLPLPPGMLSASARAVSGVSATVTASGAYRFQEDETSESRIVARIYSRQVAFSEAVPNLSSSDLSAQRAQVGLAHIIAPGGKGFWRFDINGGRAWYGGDPFFNFASFSAQRVQRISNNIRLSLSGGWEFQDDLQFPYFDSRVWSGNAAFTYNLKNGSSLSANFIYRDVITDIANRDSEQYTALFRYTHGRTIGKAKIGVEIGRSILDFDQYGFGALFLAPGGRTDKAWFGQISATFQSISYMGFVPVVTLRSESSRSNVSRFDVDQTGVSVGIRSEF